MLLYKNAKFINSNKMLLILHVALRTCVRAAHGIWNMQLGINLYVGS